jgi:pimeloyl-ACP methyl ester carboxylesterase
MPRRREVYGGPPAQRSILLADGRRLGWSEVGDPASPAVLYLHGVPGSGAEVDTLRDLAEAEGVRLIGVDRPGFGPSDPQPGRNPLDHVHDLVALADVLRLDRPPVVGYSGGGPYALGCGAIAPDRFGAIGVVAGAGPVRGKESWKRMDSTDRLLTWLGRRAPRTGGAIVAGAGWFTRALPAAGQRVWVMDLPAADRATLERRPHQARAHLELLARTMAASGTAVVEDERVLADPWGFALADVRTEVHWWHGAEDATVPLEEAASVIDELPDVDLTVVADAGHLLWSHCGEEVLRTLGGSGVDG